jgi:hypothetical protein
MRLYHVFSLSVEGVFFIGQQTRGGIGGQVGGRVGAWTSGIVGQVIV